MAGDAFQWTDRELANQMIDAANGAKQTIYETGKPVYVAPFGLDDEQSREEHIKLTGSPMAGESYDYYGRDGVKGPKAVENFTNMHIADQAMESLISIGEHYADKISQPTLVIYGSDANTAICSTAFVEKLTNDPEVMAVPNFGHVDFYHKPEAVKLSTDAVAEFFNK
jgi:pimeloyl-ACP methyl ester carboxylesterase